jgi:hypothetical protein
MKEMGVPAIADGFPMPEPNQFKSALHKALDDSQIEATKEKMKSIAKLSSAKATELNNLYFQIVEQLQKKNIKDRKVNVNWRIKCSDIGEHINVHNSLNVMFERDHGITIKDIRFVNSTVDECQFCFTSNIVFCCIPLFYWIPKWIIDGIKGTTYYVDVHFE